MLRDAKKFAKDLSEFVHRKDDQLTQAWQSYCEVIKQIPYSEYCERMYSGKLEGVCNKSHNSFIKN